VYQKTPNRRKSIVCGFFYPHSISKKYKENQVSGELNSELQMRATPD
jgi:hypothetical protein